MKIYKKSDCTIIDGQITIENEVLPLSPVVYSMLHIMDEQVQKAKFLKKQPKAQAAPTLIGFEKKSSYSLPYLDKPKTPASDKQVKQAMAIMAETDELEKVGNINTLILELQPLFDWVESEHVTDGHPAHNRIDTPEIGNPLELTSEKLVEYCKLIAEMAEIEGMEE